MFRSADGTPDEAAPLCPSWEKGSVRIPAQDRNPLPDASFILNSSPIFCTSLPEVKYMLATMIIPLFYIGLVFVCVAVTVLAVQQVSDAAKYQYRYEVLSTFMRSHGLCSKCKDPV